MTTMQQRPKEFDAHVMQWMPFLKKMAAKLESKSQDREDLVHETIVVALRRWSSYNPENSLPTWLVYQMRERVKFLRKQRSVTSVCCAGSVLDCAGVSPRQDKIVELNQVISKMRDGEKVVLLARADGETLEDVGSEIGVSSQRVHQLETAARICLRKRLNTVRVAA